MEGSRADLGRLLTAPTAKIPVVLKSPYNGLYERALSKVLEQLARDGGRRTVAEPPPDTCNFMSPAIDGYPSHINPSALAVVYFGEGRFSDGGPDSHYVLITSADVERIGDTMRRAAEGDSSVKFLDGAIDSLCAFPLSFPIKPAASPREVLILPNSSRRSFSVIGLMRMAHQEKAAAMEAAGWTFVESHSKVYAVKGEEKQFCWELPSPLDRYGYYTCPNCRIVEGFPDSRDNPTDCGPLTGSEGDIDVCVECGTMVGTGSCLYY